MAAARKKHLKEHPEKAANDAGKAWRGREHTEESKKKTSESMKAHVRTDEHKKNISKGQKGRVVSKATKKKLRIAQTGKKYSAATRRKLSKMKRGRKHWNYQGGKSKIAHSIRECALYKLWRIKVYARDNYTCRWCGKQKVAINADHIKPFALILKENKIRTIEDADACEELWDVDNGRVLCVPCHKKTETYGNNKFLKEGWQSEENH